MGQTASLPLRARTHPGNEDERTDLVLQGRHMENPERFLLFLRRVESYWYFLKIVARNRADYGEQWMEKLRWPWYPILERDAFLAKTRQEHIHFLYGLIINRTQNADCEQHIGSDWEDSMISSWMTQRWPNSEFWEFVMKQPFTQTEFILPVFRTT